MISKTFAALFALSSSVCATGETGVHASLDISILEQAKDVYMTKIIDTLNNLQLPNIDVDSKTYLHGNHLTVNQDASNVSFTADVPNNAVVLTMNDLSANFYCDAFHAHEWIFVAKGHLEVKMDTVNIGMGLNFTTQTLPDGKIVPAVNSVDVLVDINRNDIDIKIWGNIWSDFAAAFEIFFKSTVVQLIQDSVTDVLTTTIPTALNAQLATMDGSLLIPDTQHWLLDWTTPVAAIVTETSFELGAKGIMYDGVIGESEWATDFADMAYKNTTEAAQFQAYVSDVSIDSLMGSFLEVGSVAGWIYGDQLPAAAGNRTITAKELNIALPGIAAKYGDDSIVDIHGACTDLHSFTSSEANQNVVVYGTANLQFWPRFNGTTELAVEMNLVDIKFTGGINIANGNATAEITTFLVDKITITTSTIGKLSPFQLKVEFNTVSKLAVPQLNKLISKYSVPLPKDILGIFMLSNVFLYYGNGYIHAGATPTFIAPAAELPISPAMDEANEVALKLIQF